MISQEDASRYKAALEEINRLSGSVTVFAAKEIAHLALNPPQEMEEVEVKDDVFMVVCINPEHVSPSFKGIFYEKSRAEALINSASNPKDFLLVPSLITGTYSRPKPRKVLAL